MKKILFAIILLGFWVPVGSCDPPAQFIRVNRENYPDREPFVTPPTLTIESDKEVYEAGEEIGLTAIEKNVASKYLYVSWKEREIIIYLDENRNSLTYAGSGLSPFPKEDPYYMKPGESLSRKVSFKRYLKPGKHQIRLVYFSGVTCKLQGVPGNPLIICNGYPLRFDASPEYDNISSNIITINVVQKYSKDEIIAIAFSRLKDAPYNLKGMEEAMVVEYDEENRNWDHLMAERYGENLPQKVSSSLAGRNYQAVYFSIRRGPYRGYKWVLVDRQTGEVLLDY